MDLLLGLSQKDILSFLCDCVMLKHSESFFLSEFVLAFKLFVRLFKLLWNVSLFPSKVEVHKYSTLVEQPIWDPYCWLRCSADVTLFPVISGIK